MSLIHNRWLALIHDIIWIPLALLIAFWVRFNLGMIPSEFWPGIYQIIIVSLVVQTASYWYFGLYRGIWRFASVPDIFRILKAVIIGVSLSLLGVFLFSRLSNFPRSILVLYPLFLFLGLSASRLLYRWYKDRDFYFESGEKKHVLIVGAGQAGEMLVRIRL